MQSICCRSGDAPQMLSPPGHIREYSCVLSIRRGSAPEASHKRMSECHACCRACRDRMLEHFTIPL
jgi:hypothetical protein